MKKVLLTTIIAIMMAVSANAQTSLDMPLVFPKDSVNVQESQMSHLEMMAEYFKAHPKEVFFIGGFTSEATPEIHREAICDLRAQAVRKVLIEKFGVDGTYLVAIGVGVSTKSPEPEFNEKVEFFKQ